MAQLALATVDMTDATSGITDAFGSIESATLTILGAVAVVGIVLFGGIYAWKYGKKIFSVISK